jgi:hypothetical protein
MSGLNSGCTPLSFFPGDCCNIIALILGHSALSDSAVIMKVKLSHYRSGQAFGAWVG